MMHRTWQNTMALATTIVALFWTMNVYGTTNHLNQLNCDADEIAKFSGTDWECAPDENTLADLSCSTDEIAKFDGTVWRCVSETDTSAATECPIGYALVGGGVCLDMRAQYAEQQCASGIRFVDLGLTVFDCQENLEWEKKTAGNVDDTFTWSTCGGPDPAFPALGNCPPDGTAFDYIEQLNTAPCFAGHCDWRLPEMGPPFAFLGGVKLNGDPADTEELRTIQDCSFPACIDPIFGPTLLSGPTPEDTNYWTSLTIAGVPSSAWSANFYGPIGGTGGTGKSLSISVRAVRNGL